MGPLMDAADVSWPVNWAPLEWLLIQDLEALAQLAEEGNLNLHRLLETTGQLQAERFDLFLERQLGRYPPDGRLLAEAEHLLDRAQSLLADPEGVVHASFSS